MSRRPSPLMRVLAGGMSVALLTLTCLPSQLPHAEAAEQRIRFFHPDHLGSTNIVTDETGQVVEVIEYKPFGEAYKITGPDRVPHTFTSQRSDDSTGLYFYNARYYDPQLGRFIQPDALVPNPSNPQDLNRYSYVRNNPLKYTDPSGNFAFLAFFGALLIKAAIGAVVGAALNATVAAFTGGNVGKAALVGAVGGAIFGAGAAITGVPALSAHTIAATVGRASVMAGAGALAGTAGAAMTGQPIGRGAGVGAVLGGLGAVVPTPSISWLGQGTIGHVLNPVINQALTGAVVGAGAAAIQGQNIARGALGGAVYYGTGALVNATLGAVLNIQGTPREVGSVPSARTRVYRVWGRDRFGEGAGPWGRHWTTVDPRTVPDYRGAAGLPSENTGRFLSEGVLKDPTGVTTQPATYGPTTKPGTTTVPDVSVPNPAQQIEIGNVSGLNPDF